MSGISDIVVHAIYQIACTFTCSLGNPPKQIKGTGFFVRNKKEPLIFVTNKHNLDPTLKLGQETTYVLSKVSLCLRKTNSNELSLETKWFELDTTVDIKHSQHADVSAIYKFLIKNPSDLEKYQPSPFDETELADETYFNKHILMMDMASFIGFPGSNKSEWWDTEGNIPISRTVNIASFPKKPFRNPSIQTENVILVSGLSFSGSSGSPLFLHEKGLKLSGTPGQIEIKNIYYVPPKIIGIMSGHWQDPLADMFKHSGLSYFTKSTAILDLINTL